MRSKTTHLNQIKVYLTVMSKPVILTGIRSNEEPTIGNYLGAFVPMVNMQREFAGKYQVNMFVPDLHSFTTPINHKDLYQNTIQNLKYFVAAGLDLDNPDTHIYRQSFIPAHSELTWILDCFTYMGEMSRMTQFKEKSSENSESVTVGLFNYPVLMAADILLYGAEHVPVGEDQFQHIEITRDIATRFNNKFGEIFTIPNVTKAQSEFLKRDSGLRIRSLTNPTKKMSKSSLDTKSKILLIDPPEVARKKIMCAVTDDVGQINYDYDKQPGISSLIDLMALLQGTKKQAVIDKYQGQTMYGDFKEDVADVVVNFLTEFQTKLAAVDDKTLLKKLEQSEKLMNEQANQTLLKVQKAVGLR